MVGGRVCVSERPIALILMNRLYRSLKKPMSNQYDLCVTEIRSRNDRFLNAHYKARFTITTAGNPAIL